jgi:hypothetical protein
MQKALTFFKSPAAQSAILAFLASGARFQTVNLPGMVLNLKRGAYFFLSSRASSVNAGVRVFTVVFPNA